MLLQSSDIKQRSEELYKNRGKIEYLLKEVISNAIHACILREDDIDNRIEIKIDTYSFLKPYKNIKVEIKDNGCGFNKNEQECFQNIDKLNVKKQGNGLNSKGNGGRLSVIYFTDNAEFESIYKDDTGNFKKVQFEYNVSKKEQQDKLFSFYNIENIDTDANETGTSIVLSFTSKNNKNRLNKFLDGYKGKIDGLLNEIVSWFFPFFINKNNYIISVSYNGETKEFNSKDINKSTIDKINFDVEIEGKNEFFTIYITKNKNSRHLRFCGRGLEVLWVKYGKYEYKPYIEDSIYLSSEYLNNNLNIRGDEIEIEEADIISKIRNCVEKQLDGYYSKEIQNNREFNENLIKETKRKYSYLKRFINIDEDIKYKISEEELIKEAHNKRNKLDLEISQGGKNTSKEEKVKAYKTALENFVHNKKIVLEEYYALLGKASENPRYAKEEDIHNLLFARGSKDISISNLWIIDDKFLSFNEKKDSAISSKPGEKGADIYIYLDMDNDQVNPSEVLIIELKRPGKNQAHNSNKMEQQVQKQAKDFYSKKIGINGMGIETKNCRYIAIIIADKSDIDTMVRSDASCIKIIGIGDSSYYKNSCFSPSNSNDNIVSLTIEIYSYQDLYTLARRRNNMLIKKLESQD